jgi:hypothetical protein
MMGWQFNCHPVIVVSPSAVRLVLWNTMTHNEVATCR